MKMHMDEQDDERMHRDIATANTRGNDYSRLISAEFMEDDKRRHTSEDGESSLLPSIQWTPESEDSHRAEAWPVPREKRTIAEKHPALRITNGPNSSTDPSRSPTPQPRIAKPKNRVMVVSDSSEDPEELRAAPTATTAKEATTNKPASKPENQHLDAAPKKPAPEPPTAEEKHQHLSKNQRSRK